ncbi:hypothetical protein Mpsy_0183 [Methanolobus psychrophilus R15]|nr:hypothetical protein Mpsy_0183 [Methanolobus psychrophilus R15]
MTFDANLPFDWEYDTSSTDINAHSRLSIIRYETNYQFDSIKINQHFKTHLLKIGRDFGCIDVKDLHKSVHLLFAGMGDRRHVSAKFDSKTNEYLSRNAFKIKNIITSTTHVDNFPDEDNKLNLLVFNGGNIQKELIFSQYKYFLSSSLPKQLAFNETEFRKLCFEKFQDRLVDISFNPLKDPDFGNTQQAQYKSVPKNILNLDAEKIRDLKDTEDIIITSFKSSVVSTHDDLSKEYAIKFTVDINGKIELEIPTLSWIDLNSDEEIEIRFYEFARIIYDDIINKDLYNIPAKHVLSRFQKPLAFFNGANDESA